MVGLVGNSTRGQNFVDMVGRFVRSVACARSNNSFGPCGGEILTVFLHTPSQGSLSKMCAKVGRGNKKPIVDGRAECSRCFEWNPVRLFHRRGNSIRSACRKCESKRKSKYRTKDSRRKVYNPIKESARNKIHYAVRVGKIIKPDTCSGCGTPTPKHRLHGHHPDYSRPFFVDWLCIDCHALEHSE